MTTYPMQQFYSPAAPLTVDTNHAQKFFEEEDSSLLEDSVLDQSGLDSGLEMSPPMADSRRDSFAVTSALFSPKSEDWRSVEMQSVPSQGAYSEAASNNPFAPQPAHSAFGPQGQWSMSSSGSATPLQQFEGLPAEFDANASIFHRPQPMPGPTPFSNPTNQVAMFQNLGQGQTLPTSPQKDWANAMIKRDRPTSPSHRSLSELRRGDGIRKKNARFEIPAERNLSNIDNLIAQSTDETEIKELKQQKRLLRNRQAALDSRQRKKQHTERLEDEKKQFTAVMAELEDQVKQRTMEVNHLVHQLDSMQLEKQELIRAHTIETGELRKRIDALMTHVQTLETSAMPTTAGPVAHDPAEFPPTFADMEGLTMEGPWDSMPFLSGFPVEQPGEVKQEMQVVRAKKTEAMVPIEGDKANSQGGLLFMLFLVGAFVLSSRSAPSIPQVSEDVRTASAMILENVLKDAGVAQPGPAMDAMAPQPSSSADWAAAGQANSMPMAVNVVAPSMLGELTDSLTQPTQQQANEQIFSLSAAQYNGVTSQDFLRDVPAERSAATSQRRKNLAEALSNMRLANKQTAADVYTRSLLWDQIPSDVVRNFARMMAECNAQNDEQSRSNDHET